MNNIDNPSEDEPTTYLNDNKHKFQNRAKPKAQEGNQKVKKLLECHAFVCNNQADAIAIAAQLYQALVETIRKYNSHTENNTAANVTQKLNGSSSCRVGGSILSINFKFKIKKE